MSRSCRAAGSWSWPSSTTPRSRPGLTGRSATARVRASGQEPASRPSRRRSRRSPRTVGRTWSGLVSMASSSVNSGLPCVRRWISATAYRVRAVPKQPQLLGGLVGAQGPQGVHAHMREASHPTEPVGGLLRGVWVLGAVGPQDRDPRPRGRGDQVLHKVQGGRVGPVQVLDHQRPSALPAPGLRRWPRSPRTATAVPSHVRRRGASPVSRRSPARGQAGLAGRVDEHPVEDGERVVARRAVAGPVDRQRLAGFQDLLHQDVPAAGGRGQPVR